MECDQTDGKVFDNVEERKDGDESKAALSPVPSSNFVENGEIAKDRISSIALNCMDIANGSDDRPASNMLKDTQLFEEKIILPTKDSDSTLHSSSSTEKNSPTNDSDIPLGDSGKIVIEILDDDNSDAEKAALRLSRDHQYAVFLDRKWRAGEERANDDGIGSLVDDTNANPDVRAGRCDAMVNPEPIDDASSSTKLGWAEDKKIHKTSENEKKKRKPRYRLSTQSSDDDDSESSRWTEFSHSPNETRKRPFSMKLRRSTNVVSSVSDNTSSSGFDSRAASATATATKKRLCDFTGKEISMNNSNRQSSGQRRESRQMPTDSDADEISDSSSLQCQETLPSISTNNVMHNTTRVRHRKAPPPLINRKAVKESIHEISEKILFKRKVEKKNLLRRALLQHKAYNQQLSSARTFPPRLYATSTKVKYMEKKQSQLISSDGHTAIVNSSLTVLTTVTDCRVEEETERKKLHDEATLLHLMPYDFKIAQALFIDILNALPFAQRYHPEVHDIVNQKIYTPPPGITNRKLRVPSQFQEAPVDDILPAEATPKLKLSDEKNDNYESVMNSFRDFCVQCKTFDCQFHITNYPDAATQACVAIQYDKRALQRQSRELFKLNRNDPFSFLVPTTENQFVLVNDGNSDRPKTPCSVDIVDSDEPSAKSIKETINFGEHDCICPFCGFCCNDQEKLSKHIGRYHQDTFYCREIGSKITTVLRTKSKETMVPAREYFHSRSLVPIQSGHYNRDSDDESNYSWYHDYRRDMMKDLTDVSEKEKQIHMMWNRFIGCSPVIIADKDVPKRCFYFIEKHFIELEDLEWEMCQLFITFWERHLLNSIHVEKLMHLFFIKQGAKDSKQEPLTPRKRMIFSRLHLIFQTLGGDTTEKLCGALRRDSAGSDSIVKTPMIPKHLWPKFSKSKAISKTMRMRAIDMNRPFFFPCYHAGRCCIENGCTCIENDNLCTKHCIWGQYGDNFFPGCNCKGDCSEAKQCPCRDAGRECDPDICGCKASTDGCRETCGCSNMDVSLQKGVPLIVGQSQVSGAGLGLFTKKALKKGDYIDEVRGKSWHFLLSYWVQCFC